jgi:hypothetical protein
LPDVSAVPEDFTTPEAGTTATVPAVGKVAVEDCPVPPLAVGSVPVTPVLRLTFVIVLEAPEIVLLVKTADAEFFVASEVLSTLLRPTSDLVKPVGVLIAGEVSVLFVRV